MNTKGIFFIAAAITLAACTQLENPRVPVSLTYSTIDAAETKAAQSLNEGFLANGESVMVRISNTGAAEWTDYTFITVDAGAMTAPNPGPNYPEGSQNIDIVAYYPATAGTSFTVATDQTADASYKASDLMFASVTDQAKQAEAVNLAFTHKMSKLNVNITAGQGVGSITGVSLLNVKPTVSFNPSTGEVGEAEGLSTSIAISNNGAVVIPAQTIDGGLLSIVTDKGTAIYSVSSKAFEAGKFYTLNITVNLRAVGTTTALYPWISDYFSLNVQPVLKDKSPAGAEAVDLGHPTVKWANMNVGAFKETDYGDYFSWFETRPYYTDHDAYGNKTEGSWIDYKTGYDSYNYNYTGNGHTENDIGEFQFDYAHDTARQNWGGYWRMPTRDEWVWLWTSCTWTWQNDYKGTDVDGMLVTSNVEGYTDKSIFLPAASYWRDRGLNNSSFGYYWSSTLHAQYTDYPYYVLFANSTDISITFMDVERYYGLPVRPVTE